MFLLDVTLGSIVILTYAHQFSRASMCSTVLMLLWFVWVDHWAKFMASA